MESCSETAAKWLKQSLLGLHTLTCPRKSLPVLCLCVVAQFLMLNYFPHTWPKGKTTPQCYKRPCPCLSWGCDHTAGSARASSAAQLALACPSWVQRAESPQHTARHSTAAKFQHQVWGSALSPTNLSCRPGHRLAHFKLC